ncbi:aromatic ring-hydroxylating dioxygenase subunit alpha [Sphingomonas sp. CGMCC 1.13654]|uniref:Aromatic ring-hydroxylating dioxygenase subunit alpha n=1 Tax=Sphingomonas chungangi TaxID=2683589 RepID=A0A838L5X1_9SPHN|nr:aromatic ring-hydroxylating dioxygenase subunit alpha [Sphingomonas chungangi]MBA2933576.1 aromatic ring-hydroxylating dioxygenase subunit alpha [Sphingomonas chungangi]MVW54909.1 Rieske 2Fe-2S domain-containing protein [Sphingomonas chungangi]
MSYLRNCWYLAAWSDEVAAGALLARRFLDEPIVIFRDGEGRVQALNDRCPHRFAPLSRGRLGDGVLSCGYHGLAFDGSGRCVRNPHGPVVGSMAVRRYALVEAYRAIWIWMGDADDARVDRLCDLGFLDEAPDTAFSKGYLHGEGHYQLFVDNILDLTHADYLHADTLGSGAFTRTRARITEAADRITVLRDCRNEVPTPLMRVFRGITEEDRVDYWNTVEWFAPAILTLRGGNLPAGAPRDGTLDAMATMNVHIFTPETARSTHYFFASTRDFAVDDAEFNARFAETRYRIFTTEDEPMIAAQQDRIGERDLADLQPLMLRIDEGSVRVRRKLQQMIDAESASARILDK